MKFPNFPKFQLPEIQAPDMSKDFKKYLSWTLWGLLGILILYLLIHFIRVAATGDSILRGVVTASTILGIAYLVLASARIVPAFHYGVKIRLGVPQDDPLPHGLCFTWPLIDRVVAVSRELRIFEFNFEFTAADNLRIAFKNVILQFRGDPEVMIDDVNEKDPLHKRNVFISVDEKSFRDGIPLMLKSRLAALGGTVNGEDLIHNKHGLIDFIHCFLMAGEMPHYTHDPQSTDASICNIQGCTVPKAPVPAEKLILYYSTHFSLVKKWLEGNKGTSRSLVERRFGIQIVGCEVGDIEFSPATEKILEEQKQARIRDNVLKTKLAALEAAMKAGLPPQLATNLVEATFNPGETNRKIVSVEGEAGIGTLAAAIGGSKGGR